MSTVSITEKMEPLKLTGNVRIQLNVPELIEIALNRGEGKLTAEGALAVETGAFTGRSPRDKYIVNEKSVNHQIDWGNVNQPLSSERFAQIVKRLQNYLKEQDELFVFEGYAGADKNYRLPVKVITEYAWQNLFVRQLFICTDQRHNPDEKPFTVACLPNFKADPSTDETNSETIIAVNFSQRLVVIGGTHYAGEMKKAIFSVLNYLLVEDNVLPMHCSANAGEDGDVALFFGLSGTGKTTLSADPKRMLIGDDEHGWSEKGIFNFEGGCYAKCIGLSQDKEPQIWNAIGHGTVLENVVLDANRRPDYHNSSLTENTRGAYSIDMIPNAMKPSIAGHPQVIFFLTADAFGVLPPISRLTPKQAMYHFLSGYTSKLAGTERGITEPEATFSSCFGAPFLPRKATVYAEMLREKLEQFHVPVYLVNTGWTGGAYGVGQRMKLTYTRAMIQAAIRGELQNVHYEENKVFNLQVPHSCPGVPDELLIPKNTWDDPEQYEIKAAELAVRFQKHMKQFATFWPS